MPTKVKDNIELQPIDFRYDEGLRGRTDIESSSTITTNHGFSSSNMIMIGGGNNIMKSKLRIRKLTPLECMKLQGFTKEDYEAIKTKFSDSAIYHVMGDAISVSVIIALFGSMTELDYRKAINEYVEKEVIENV